MIESLGVERNGPREGALPERDRDRPVSARAAAVLATLAVLAATSAAGTAAPAEERVPSPAELRAAVERAYRALPAYRDEGEIERTENAGGETTVRRWHFETAAAGGALRLVLRDAAGGERVLWGDAGDGGIYDPARGQRLAFGSAAAAVAGLPGAAGLGSGGLDALAVPALLAGSSAPLADPSAAAVDGPEPCGDGAECWVLTLAFDGGAVRSRLVIERERLLIFEAEVELLAPALPAPGPPGAATLSGGAAIRWRVSHRPGSPPAAGEVAYAPPPGSRRVERWEPSAPAPAQGSGGADPQAGFGESIEVALRTLVVRALDRSGDPIPGLGAADFVVHAGRGAGRRELPVVAVDWVAAGGAADDEAGNGMGAPRRPGGEGADGGAGPAGRLVLLFVQTDPQAIRLRGQFKQLPFARELIEALPADDRLAVVSFDSHLKLWQDFTGDRDAVYEALERAAYFGGRPAGRRPDGPGLGERWDPRVAMAVATAERGLEMTAEALVALPGEKAVIWLGWGLGRLDRGVVRRNPGHAEAVAALAAARASVFVLDVTDAEYHDLEMGLRAIAEETGGTYDKTHTFAGQVTRRLARTLAGHYELSVDVSAPPGAPAGLGEMTVELRDRPGRVLVRPPAD